MQHHKERDWETSPAEYYFLLAFFQPGMFLGSVYSSTLQKTFAGIMERMEQHGQVRHALKWVLLLESCVREWMKKGCIYEGAA